MKYIVTAKEMKEYDNNTITQIGIPALVLMERAALALQEKILKNVPRVKSVMIVAGTGNNGADGLALARLLAEKNCQVSLCVVGDLHKATEQFVVQYNILKHYCVDIFENQSAIEKLEDLVTNKVVFDVLVDALFGVGLSRTVEGSYAQVLEYMNAIKAYKIAADISSGISADTGKILGTAFRADITVTFGFAKRGLLLYPGTDYAGEVVVADIGIGENSFGTNVPQAFTYEENPVALLPQRQNAGNKGTFGKVLIIAGFEHMAGAAVLCAKAALEIGAGMVKVICPQENRTILQTAVPEVLYGTCENLESSLKWADVVAIGPGLGKSIKAAEVLQKILENTQLPLVLDADALNLISENEKLQKLVMQYTGAKIMTPHMGELSRLTQKSISEIKVDIFAAVKGASVAYKAVVVGKDARTVVADVNDDVYYLNCTGNNGMATAGSGDVLTGILAGLLAQGMEDFKAATVAVYMHGLAGDVVRDAYTEYGVTAGKIVENIKELLIE